MRIRRDISGPIVELDLTPMIDMTFQLIAFFMFALNFAQTELDERVQLPDSVLAKPPDSPLESPITLHLRDNGMIVLGGQLMYPEGLRPFLVKEATALEINGKTPASATVVIRADRRIEAGKVQELIRTCQENRFEKFALRAKEDLGD